MAQFSFDLVSPERLVFSGPVTEVVVPGSEGELGIMAGHAPLITTLRPGILTVKGEGADKKLYVRGGFAEVSAKGLTVLAEEALPLEQVDSSTIEAAIASAEADVAAATSEEAKGVALARVNDLKNLALALGASRAH